MSGLAPSTTAAAVFSTSEREVIEHWFEQPDDSPSVYTPIGQYLTAQEFDDVWDYSTTAAFVARLALAAVEDALPQWASVSDAGVTLGRHIGSAAERFDRAVQLRPRHLFEINWADSGPGFSWPCDYWATWFPGYARWIVTASVDSTDVWNVCDVAIGWFDDSRPLVSGAHDAIVREWRGPADTEIYPWECLFSTGLIDEQTAYTWRAEVWPETVDERCTAGGLDHE